MRTWEGTTSSTYFLPLLFLQCNDDKETTIPNLHQCFSSLFCLWTLRINSANGLEIKSTEGQSSLTVTNVTEEHYGNYTCVAANNLGVTNASLVLFSKYMREQGAAWGTELREFSCAGSCLGDRVEGVLPWKTRKSFPYLLKVNLNKNQCIATETKTQVRNPSA